MEWQLSLIEGNIYLRCAIVTRRKDRACRLFSTRAERKDVMQFYVNQLKELVCCCVKYYDLVIEIMLYKMSERRTHFVWNKEYQRRASSS